jgi:hypothetical protein
MNRRLSGIVLLAVLLLLPEGIYAERPGIISFIVEPLEYTDLGVIADAIRIPKKGFVVTTQGLKAEGWIDCDGDSNCIAAGLDTETLHLQQVLQLEIGQIDRNAGTMQGVRGQTMGLLSWQRGESPNPFKGRVKGYALAVDFDADGDVDGADFIMNISAKTKGGGKVELQLHGIIREVVPDGLRWDTLDASNVVFKYPGR